MQSYIQFSPLPTLFAPVITQTQSKPVIAQQTKPLGVLDLRVNTRKFVVLMISNTMMRKTAVEENKM